jgi:hypothetical protein
MSLLPITSSSVTTSYLRVAESTASPKPLGSQLSELFLAATPIPSSTPLSLDREVVSLSNLWETPYNAFFGGLWGFLFISGVFDLSKSGIRLHQKLTVSDLTVDPWEDLKQFLFDGVSLTGLIANVGDWADRGKMVALGSALPYFQTVGHGASCITSSVRAYKSYEQILEQAELLSQTDSPVKRGELEQKQLLSSLELAAYGTMAVWAFVGFGALILGLVAPPLLMISLASVSLVLATAAIFYKIHLFNVYPKTI